MSVSPLLEPSPVESSSSAQLATLLSDTCREAESLRRDLSTARKRAEKAERLLASFTQASTSAGSSNQPQISDAAARTILECESRVERAEQARDDADARRRLITDNWSQLERYLFSLEIHSADARVGFSRILAEGSGQLVLANVPLAGVSPQQHHHHHHTMPPPAPRHPGRGASSLSHRSSQSVQAFPSNLPLPPPPNPNNYPHTRVRQRAGSLEAAMTAGQPPTKKSRGDARGKDGREDRAMFTESPVDSHILSHGPQYQHSSPASHSPQTQHALPQHPNPYPRSSKDYEPDLRERTAYIHRQHSGPVLGASSQRRIGVQYSGPRAQHSHRRLKRTHSQTRSQSPSSRSSASSLSLDEMLLQATADDAERRSANGIPNGSGSASGPGTPPPIRQPHAAAHHRHRPPSTPHPPPEISYTHSNPRIRPDSPSSDYRSHTQRSRSSAALPVPSPHSHGHASAAAVMSGPGVPAPPNLPPSETAGPLPQPGQVQTYQTHVFAPVVTGAPVKKSKFMNSSVGAGPAGPVGVPLPPANGSTSAIMPEPTPVPTSYPPTNAQGQRICRQCGLPGRYKEGKCVEKWGPGPHGPGTVCDRCRKKMKRVERRGTAEGLSAASLAARQLQPPAPFRGAHLTSQGPDRAVHRSDTLPVPHPHPNHSGQLGPAGTHLLSPQPSYAAHERPRDDPPRPAAAPPQGKPTRGTPRSPPPTIATLGESDPESGAAEARAPRHSMVGPGSRGESRSDSRNGRSHRPSPHRSTPLLPDPVAAVATSSKRSPLVSDGSSGGKERSEADLGAAAEPDGDGEAETEVDADAEAEADADAEAEVDAEADGDADAELLEAVDAAEANSSGSGGGAPWPKKEDL